MTDQERIKELEEKIRLYEQNGAAKLYYSLNRKMNEMADLMNKNNLAYLAIDDPKDKSFERLKAIWNDASSIALGAKAVGDVAGITGDEVKDMQPKSKYNTPESIANVLGNTAGQQD